VTVDNRRRVIRDRNVWGTAGIPGLFCVNLVCNLQNHFVLFVIDFDANLWHFRFLLLDFLRFLASTVNAVKGPTGAESLFAYNHAAFRRSSIVNKQGKTMHQTVPNKAE